MAHISCHFCGNMVNTDAPNAVKEVIGWVGYRGPKAGGGVNHIRQQDPTGRWAHKACLHPVEANQEGLF